MSRAAIEPSDMPMASALPIDDLSVGMRNDSHDQAALKNRPERIPIDPEHRSYSRNVTGSGAVDSLLQNSRRLEHDCATRRNRHLCAGLRVATDTRTSFKLSCHSSVALQFQNPRSPLNAHRGIGMRVWFTHPLIKALSFALVDLCVSARAKNDALLWAWMPVGLVIATRTAEPDLFKVAVRRDF
jgi:hypothetical protein